MIKYDLITKSGNDSVYELDLIDLGNNPIDVSSSEIIAQVRTKSNIYLFDFEVVVVDAPTGSIRLIIDGNDTINLTGVFYWDVRITSPQGVQNTQTGTIQIRESKSFIEV